MQEAERAVAETASAKQAICDALAHKIVGQKDVIDALLISLFAKGHCLFSGVPGLAKTLLVSTLASLTNLSFSRIQFTPDLMPSMRRPGMTKRSFRRFFLPAAAAAALSLLPAAASAWMFSGDVLIHKVGVARRTMKNGEGSISRARMTFC